MAARRKPQSKPPKPSQPEAIIEPFALATMRTDYTVERLYSCMVPGCGKHEAYRANCNVPKWGHLCVECFTSRTLPWERPHYTRVALYN